MRGYPGAADYLRHLEEVARQLPDAETRLPQIQERYRAMAAAKAGQAEHPEGDG